MGAQEESGIKQNTIPDWRSPNSARRGASPRGFKLSGLEFGASSETGVTSALEHIGIQELIGASIEEAADLKANHTEPGVLTGMLNDTMTQIETKFANGVYDAAATPLIEEYLAEMRTMALIQASRDELIAERIADIKEANAKALEAVYKARSARAEELRKRCASSKDSQAARSQQRQQYKERKHEWKLERERLKEEHRENRRRERAQLLNERTRMRNERIKLQEERRRENSRMKAASKTGVHGRTDSNRPRGFKPNTEGTESRQRQEKRTYDANSATSLKQPLETSIAKEVPNMASGLSVPGKEFAAIQPDTASSSTANPLPTPPSDATPTDGR